METAMESLKTMVDVNTILGDPVETPDGQVILPVSRVSFGFAAGGGEYAGSAKEEKHPFGGGSGAGIALATGCKAIPAPLPPPKGCFSSLAEPAYSPPPAAK
ncbi:MAG TPA: hypothetical protein GX528_05095, partial [Firmicutes bacterium]|nr:hypothetical protein [Bacillota bacterium]